MNNLKLILPLFLINASAHGMLTPLTRATAKTNPALTALVRHITTKPSDDKTQEAAQTSQEKRLLELEKTLQRQSLAQELDDARRLKIQALMLTTAFSSLTAIGFTWPHVPVIIPGVTGLLAGGLAYCYHLERKEVQQCLSKLEEFDKTASNNK